jgi:hypothetical protein
VNELSQTLDVESLLADAEVLFLTFRAVMVKRGEDREKLRGFSEGTTVRRRARGNGMKEKGKEVEVVRVEEESEVLKGLLQ